MMNQYVRLRDRTLDHSLQSLLLGIVALNAIPHAFALPPWLTALSASLMVWSALHLFRGYRLPGRAFLIFAAIAGTGAIAFQYQAIFGQEPASALLVFLAGLKLLETTKYRDAMILIFTSFFLLMAFLLTSQSLGTTIYMAVDVMMITSLLFHLHKRDRRMPTRSLRPALRLLILALPLWIFLFILFPRFSAGFWRLTVPKGPSTGFSDEMNPGSVANLIESDEVAFRVSFPDGLRLSPESMYWRGAILTQGNGLKWKRDTKSTPPLSRNIVAMTADVLVQEIALEPKFKTWLFGLDVPLAIEFNDPIRQRQTRGQSGFVFQTDKDITQRILYVVKSAPTMPVETLTSEERALLVSVPDTTAESVRELALRLRAGGSTTQEAITRVLDYFDNEGFRYTRSPGPLRRGGLDEFLFESRRGFCEHFSGAFATLMRLMDIPARVVVGFQGGRANDLGDYLLVKDRDAHAWTEVWVSERSRWERVDPTATIAPLRLQVGGDYFNVPEDQLSGNMTPDQFQMNFQAGMWFRWQMKAELVADAVTNRWNDFLLRYDFEYQRQLFAKLGLSEASRWIFMMWVLIGTLVFLGLFTWILKRQSVRQDPVRKAWNDFCRKLEVKTGVGRAINEGPYLYTRRATQTRPELAGAAGRIAELYVTLRYGPRRLDFDLAARQFRREVRLFLSRKET